MSYMFLDTRFASFSDVVNKNPADSTFNLNSNLGVISPNFQIALAECSIPVLQANFLTGVNDKIYFQENGSTSTTYVATIPTTTAGANGINYDAISLATTIASAMNSAGASNTYYSTYNASTKQISIYTTLPNTFRLLDSTTCLKELGYLNNGTTTFLTAQTGPLPVSLQGSRYVDILVNFPTNSISLDSRINKLGRVYLNAGYGSIQTYLNPNVLATAMTVSSDALQTIEIRICDDAGRIYALPSNQYASYTLYMSPVV